MATEIGMRAAAHWLCAALAGMGAATPAWADARARLDLEDFGWSLVDLRPGDGIAPGVTFDTSRIDNRMVARVQETYAGPDGRPLPYRTDITYRYVGRQAFFPRASVYAFGNSSATVSQGNDARDFDLTLGGYLRNTAGDGVLVNRFDAHSVPAASSFVGAIVLAPYTRLVWSGDLRMELETTGGARPHEGAMAAFHLRMLGADGRRLGGYSTRFDTEGDAPGVLVREQSLRFSLSNASAAPLAGTLQASMRATGYTSQNPVFAPAVAAVPEPGAVGLMLAGVGVVGMAARRGRRARGAQA